MKKLALLFILALSNVANAWIIDGLGEYKFEALNDKVHIMHGPLGEPNVQNHGFMNNPGIIIGQHGVVVVDPGSTLEVGNRVLQEIQKITQKPVVAVFNTHVHGDHWLGNQAIVAKYPEVKIYAHPQMIAQAKDGEGELWLGIMNSSTDGLSKGTIAVYPTDATSHLQEITAAGETFRIHNDVTPNAHTNNDIMIEHLSSKTLFLGDNDMVDRFGRFGGTSDVHGNIKVLQYAIGLNLNHYVPGHGPSGNADEAVVPFLTYLNIIKSFLIN